MSINLAPYPDTNRVPSIFAILNSSNANTGQVNQRTLIIGQMLAGGTYVPNIPVVSTGIGDCQAGAGSGAMLTQMLWRYRKADSFGEVWLLPVNTMPQLWRRPARSQSPARPLPPACSIPRSPASVSQSPSMPATRLPRLRPIWLPPARWCHRCRRPSRPMPAPSPSRPSTRGWPATISICASTISARPAVRRPRPAWPWPSRR